MGWTGFSNSVKQEKERHISYFRNQGTLIAHRSTNYGKNLWIAIKISPDSNGQERSIILLLIFKNGGSGEWLYRDLDEGMGPCETDCPISLLEITTGDGSVYSQEWRKEVLYRSSFRKELSSIKDGTIVEIYGERFQIVRKEGKKGIYGHKLGMSTLYRIRPSQIGRIAANSEQYFLEEDKHDRQQSTTPLGGGR